MLRNWSSNCSLCGDLVCSSQSKLQKGASEIVAAASASRFKFDFVELSVAELQSCSLFYSLVRVQKLTNTKQATSFFLSLSFSFSKDFHSCNLFDWLPWFECKDTIASHWKPGPRWRLACCLSGLLCRWAVQVRWSWPKENWLLQNEKPPPHLTKLAPLERNSL